jgi:hypothetical protein
MPGSPKLKMKKNTVQEPAHRECNSIIAIAIAGPKESASKGCFQLAEIARLSLPPARQSAFFGVARNLILGQPSRIQKRVISYVRTGLEP